MRLIFTIAIRNIFRHKGKTFVIGTILFLGALIMTVGSGIIEGLNRGLQKNIVESFTGDIVLISEKQDREAVLFDMTGQSAESINNYKFIEPKLKTLPFIKDFLPAGIGYVWILNETGQPIDQYFFGVDFKKYRKFFNESLTAVEGRLFEENERGVLLPTTIRNMLYDYCNYWVIPQNCNLSTSNFTDNARKDYEKLIKFDIRKQLIFMGLSDKNSSLDILSNVVGIVKFKALNSILGFYSIVDIESFRECMGFTAATEVIEKPNKMQKSILEIDDLNLDNLFSSNVNTLVSSAKTIDKSIFKSKKKEIKNIDLNLGAYNLIFVKLDKNISISEAINKINNYSNENNLGIKAISWSTALGMMGQMSVIMKSALYLFVSFIFFVAIIIIMNTLSMAAMERISEIGMMRAVGAKKIFVGNMFLAETLALSITFGVSGILVGIVVVNVLALLNISTTNEVLQIFYGGNTFHPVLGISNIFMCLVLLAIVTLLASIYPILVARKIKALDAISRD